MHHQPPGLQIGSVCPPSCGLRFVSRNTSVARAVFFIYSIYRLFIWLFPGRRAGWGVPVPLCLMMRLQYLHYVNSPACRSAGACFLQGSIWELRSWDHSSVTVITLKINLKDYSSSRTDWSYQYPKGNWCQRRHVLAHIHVYSFTLGCYLERFKCSDIQILCIKSMNLKIKMDDPTQDF